MDRAEQLAEGVGRFSRAHLHLSQALGDRAAAKIVGGMGSWRFFFVQTVVVLSWVAANLYLLSKPFDPYPAPPPSSRTGRFLYLPRFFPRRAAPLAAPTIRRCSGSDQRRMAASDIFLLVSSENGFVLLP